MDQSIPGDSSPTIGDIRWLGAKSVMLLCQTCQHRQVANIALLPDAVPLALLASKFVCPNCHQNGAHALPNWEASPNQPSPDQDQKPVRPSSDEGDHRETE
jgi:hypothetical protein